MYTQSYSFNPDICLHIHSAECTVRLLNQAGRNNYSYNPKFVGNTGNRTRDLMLEKCLSTQQLYQLSYSGTKAISPLKIINGSGDWLIFWINYLLSINWLPFLRPLILITVIPNAKG